MMEGNNPVRLQVGILDLYSHNLYNAGQYAMRMASPVSAENLTIQFRPTSEGLATDIWRIMYFYSKKGAAIKATNASQTQNVDFGSEGGVSSQGAKA
jgi:hypothetical protein